MTQATVSSLILLTTADYANNANLEPEGPTLVRIRGNIVVDSIIATAWTFWLSCCAYDMDTNFSGGVAGPNDPSSYQNMTDEEVLMWTCHRFGARTVATAPQPLIIPLDIKAKRRLKDTTIRLDWVASNGAAGQDGTLTCNARLLLIGNAAT